MQPRNLPVVEADDVELLDAGAELDELAAGALVMGLLVALDELLPHAAMSRLAAPAATAATHGVCLNWCPSLDLIADAQA
jgi:hypothetical protein